MIVVVTRSGVTLLDPEDTKRLHVEVRDGLDTVQADLPLRQARLGTFRESDAFLLPAGLHSLAGPAATPEWREAFSAMAAYAASNGWVDSDGALQAHVEFVGGDGK